MSYYLDILDQLIGFRAVCNGVRGATNQCVHVRE